MSPTRIAMKAITTLVVVAALVSFGQPVEADILDADGLAACTEVSNAADRLLASRYVPGFIASLRSAADRGARSTDPYVRNAAQRLRVTTFDEAVPAVKIFMQACVERVAQKPNVQVWGPTAAPPAAPAIPPTPAPPTQQGGLIGTLDRASGSVERLTNRLRDFNQEMQRATGTPAAPVTPTVTAPSAKPAPMVTSEEAERQAKRAAERNGQPNAKCTTKMYGGGAAVTVCE